MTMQETIGVDVSKDHLDAFDAGPKDHRRFSVIEILSPLVSGVPQRASDGHADGIFHDGGVRWRMVETAARCAIR